MRRTDKKKQSRQQKRDEEQNGYEKQSLQHKRDEETDTKKFAKILGFKMFMFFPGCHCWLAAKAMTPAHRCHHGVQNENPPN